MQESRDKFGNDRNFDEKDKSENPQPSMMMNRTGESAGAGGDNQFRSMGSMAASQAQNSEGLDESMYHCYNQYISVEVSEPMWSNEGVVGGYRMYRIITKLKDNPDYAI